MPTTRYQKIDAARIGKMAGTGTITGATYRVTQNGRWIGWVALAGREWLAWDTAGRLWSSYGKTRDAAAIALSHRDAQVSVRGREGTGSAHWLAIPRPRAAATPR